LIDTALCSSIIFGLVLDSVLDGSEKLILSKNGLPQYNRIW
jgi:hypothetical protein